MMNTTNELERKAKGLQDLAIRNFGFEDERTILVFKRIEDARKTKAFGFALMLIEIAILDELEHPFDE